MYLPLEKNVFPVLCVLVVKGYTAAFNEVSELSCGGK